MNQRTHFETLENRWLLSVTTIEQHVIVTSGQFESEVLAAGPVNQVAPAQGTLTDVAVSFTASVHRLQSLELIVGPTGRPNDPPTFNQTYLTTAAVNAPGLSSPIQVSKDEEIHAVGPNDAYGDLLVSVHYDYTENYGGETAPKHVTDLSKWIGTGTVVIPVSAHGFLSEVTHGGGFNYNQTVETDFVTIDAKIVQTITVADAPTAPAKRPHGAKLRLVSDPALLG